MVYSASTMPFMVADGQTMRFDDNTLQQTSGLVQDGIKTSSEEELTNPQDGNSAALMTTNR